LGSFRAFKASPTLDRLPLRQHWVRFAGWRGVTISAQGATATRPLLLPTMAARNLLSRQTVEPAIMQARNETTVNHARLPHCDGLDAHRDSSSMRSHPEPDRTEPSVLRIAKEVHSIVRRRGPARDSVVLTEILKILESRLHPMPVAPNGQRRISSGAERIGF
jgi:hypothetical protein